MTGPSSAILSVEGLGVLAPSAGRILIEGADLSLQRGRALARTNFAAVYAPPPGNLTVERNLRVFGMIYPVAVLPAWANRGVRRAEGRGGWP